MKRNQISVSKFKEVKQETKGIKLSDLHQITIQLELSKEQMEYALNQIVMRIHGVLYDMPIEQLNNFLLNKQFGIVSLTLTKAKSQELPKQPKP